MKWPKITINFRINMSLIDFYGKQLLSMLEPVVAVAPVTFKIGKHCEKCNPFKRVFTTHNMVV